MRADREWGEPGGIACVWVRPIYGPRWTEISHALVTFHEWGGRWVSAEIKGKVWRYLASVEGSLEGVTVVWLIAEARLEMPPGKKAWLTRLENGT